MIAGVVIPKVEACLDAIDAGVGSGAHTHPRRTGSPRGPVGTADRRWSGHEAHPDRCGAGSVSAVTSPYGGPLMATYPVPTVTFARGAGSRLWDVDGKAYLDLLGGLAVVPPWATPIRPSPTPWPNRPGPWSTSPEPVRHDGRPRGGNHPRPVAGWRRQGVLRQPQAPRRTSAPLSWPAGGPVTVAMSWSAPSARSTGAPSPPCTPPASPRSTRRSNLCPRASATWPGTTPPPSRRRSTSRWQPSCCAKRSRCREKVASTRPRPSTSPPCGGSPATSATCCSWSTRSRPAWVARGHGSPTSTSTWSPTWSPWPKPSAMACQSGPAGPAPR